MPGVKPEEWNTATNQIVTIQHRQNLNDDFALARKEPSDTICAVCNADCFFDATITRLRDEDMHGKFLIISRIEPNGSLPANSFGCQDAWAWLSQDTPKQWEDLEFGRGAVDHRIICNALNHGLEPLNVCDVVRVQHLHSNWQILPTRYPSYPYPHGLCWPRENGKSRVYIRKSESDWPPEERGLKYPRLVQRIINGHLKIMMTYDTAIGQEPINAPQATPEPLAVMPQQHVAQYPQQHSVRDERGRLVIRAQP